MKQMPMSNIAREICMEEVLCLHSEPDAFARSFETNARWYCLYIGFICMVVQIKEGGTFCNFRKIISLKMLVWGKILFTSFCLCWYWLDLIWGVLSVWEIYAHHKYGMYRHYREITYKCVQPSFWKKIGHYAKQI